MTITGFDDYHRQAATGAQVFWNMPASTYHSDADGPRLSQSLATTCLNSSPLHAWQAHPLLGNRDYKYEPSEDDGTLIHSLVLEPDSSQILEVDPRDIKTKDGKIAKSPFATEEGKKIRADALASGRIPVLTDKLDMFKYKAKAVRSRLYDLGISFDGASEVVIYWDENGVRCRCRQDHLIISPDQSEALIIDLKSTECAHPNKLKGSCWEYGYDIQEAAYRRAVEAAWPSTRGRVRVLFAFCELDKPYAVNPVELTGDFRALGETRWLRGQSRWAECLKSNRWTGYTEAVGRLGPPPWARTQEMTEE